ncbi:NAD(P)H-hydrate dehydratase [Pseudaminobacter arsenicus]|uniref:Bifunctional NAD(P)H-hydrate repair enzyme n=1 Tax=Borborobacter arsenicus TaxID=1851146 RepID=A0A432V6Q0_9HYPH|nr:NAD(P)H-hydrate dehydratase [Pseudaminobacter arsenicus]RUM97866.1 NAD(P)H-hydrate dehydratase [Pseudaminobacter arsenicus]
MAHEILTPAEMALVDRAAIEGGPLSGIDLMHNAGHAVAALILERFSGAAKVDVLCGPGNNGGDGYVVAGLLSDAGMNVALYAQGRPRVGSDAAIAARECPIQPQPLADYEPEAGSVIVDALFGAGLSKPLSHELCRIAEATSSRTVVAVDLPSGVSGETGVILGAAFRAAITVTFTRKKPGHLLLPGRDFCGEVVVADIGIGDRTVAAIGSACVENTPAAWIGHFPAPNINSYKYSRGHVGVFSGGPAATGAARLAAMGAARIGAGAVTLLSPSASTAINAAHLTSIILREADTLEEVLAFLEARRPHSLVYGPGLGAEADAGDFLLAMLAKAGGLPSLVLDADGLSTFAGRPELLFDALHRDGAPATVLSPHEGEFRRLFPDIAGESQISKLEKARAAAKRSGAVIIYKGPDTVIAAPSGYAAINGNGTPLLATAGSGDVLSGICAGLLAQGMPPFEAACAAVWAHADAALRFGPGLIAEDLPLALLPTIRELLPARQAERWNTVFGKPDAQTKG